MSTELVLLGTAGGPTPKRTRSAPAQAVVVDDHVYVVDCGSGVARQLALAGLPPSALSGVFITHHHSDHNADYGNLFLLSWASNLAHTVPAFGPPPLLAMTEHFFRLNAEDIEIRIRDEGRPSLRDLIDPHEVTEPGEVFQDERVTVTATLVDHPPFETALAYRFDTPDRSIVISGDTAYSPALVKLAQGADILVHEVLFSDALDWIVARSNGTTLRKHLVDSHTDVSEVGKVAQQAGVGMLVLSHLVPSDAGITEEQWKQAAVADFHGDVVVGEDLMRL